MLGQGVRALFPTRLGPSAPGKGNSSADGLKVVKGKCCACQGWFVCLLIFGGVGFECFV